MAWLEERVLPYLTTPSPGSVPGEGEAADGGAKGTLELAKDIVEVSLPPEPHYHCRYVSYGTGLVIS